MLFISIENQSTNARTNYTRNANAQSASSDDNARGDNNPDEDLDLYTEKLLNGMTTDREQVTISSGDGNRLASGTAESE